MMGIITLFQVIISIDGSISSLIYTAKNMNLAAFCLPTLNSECVIDRNVLSLSIWDIGSQ